METNFYKNINVIDAIRNKENISEDEFHVIQDYIVEEKYAKYFFADLQNPIWINLLYKQGYFYEIPDIVEEKPGSFRALDWPAGRYLLLFADQFEDIIVDIVQKTKTENWIVQGILIDCILKISTQKAAKLLPKIDLWLNGRFTQMFSFKLPSLCDFFIKNNYYKEATKILEISTLPILEKREGKSSTYFPPIQFRIDHFWVNEFIEKQYPKLILSDTLGIVSVFKHHLEKTIEIVQKIYPDEVEEKVGYYWRLEISHTLSEHSEEVLDILIDGLINALLELCSKSDPKTKEVLDQFYSSKHIIFRRIALYILRIQGKKIPELVTKALLEYDLLHKMEFQRDYTGLLRDQFDILSSDYRKQVIQFILEGPKDIEQRANRHAQSENHEVTDKDRQIVQDQWKQYYLGVLRNFLPEDTTAYLNHLDETYGKPDITEKPLVTTSSWGSIPSPLSHEQIAKMDFHEFQKYLLDYEPKDLFLNPRESLGRTFQQLVSEKPSLYISFASLLNHPDMRFLYIYHYLFGIREGIKKEHIHLDDELLSLCKHVVQTRIDPFLATAGDYEPGLLAAQRETAALLEQSLKTADPYLSQPQLDIIRDLLIDLCHHPDPETNDENISNFDPFTQSFNCVRGVAMHAIFQLALYLGRKEQAKPEKSIIELKIQNLLEEKLDKHNDPSPAVHSVYGCFLTQLHYLSREWLISHLSAIFPQEEENFKYWKAAWEAYIISSNVYSAIVALLIPQYQRGLLSLKKLKDGTEYWGNSPTERLAQHVFLIYLRNLTDFNHENKLLDLFFENADDATRSQGIFWLSKILENEKPSADNPLWSKYWNLWQKRIDYAETQEPSQNSQEISEYLRWLKYCPLEMEELFPILQKIIKYLHDSYDCSLITEYAAIQSKNFPFESVTLMQMVILSAKEPWWNPKDEDKRKILENAMASQNEKAKGIAIEVINFLGEKGEYSWRELLP